MKVGGLIGFRRGTRRYGCSSLYVPDRRSDFRCIVAFFNLLITTAAGAIRGFSHISYLRTPVLAPFFDWHFRSRSSCAAGGVYAEPAEASGPCELRVPFREMGWRANCLLVDAAFKRASNGLAERVF
jgi:hypothetical protein